jgi:2-oxoglutarate dehydrogenase E2 component (dihydrolipoamide succinyltransferase)
MTIEIKVPVLPESVADATIATWHVKAGETVTRDQNLVDIETDKVVLEVVAPADGVLSEILHGEGDTVLGEDVIGKVVEASASNAASSHAPTSAAATQAASGSGVSSQIKVPVLPESVADATIATWHVQAGEAVSRDQNLVDIETDKVVLEVVAPADGSISEILAQEGETVLAEAVIANFVEGAAAQAASPAAAEASSAGQDEGDSDALSPSVRRLLAEKGVDANKVKGKAPEGASARCCGFHC